MRCNTLQHTAKHYNTLQHAATSFLECPSSDPLTEEIRLKMFGSPDPSVFLIDLLSARDSVYSRENLYEILGTPVKTSLIWFDMHGDCCENLLEILAVVII